MSEKMAQYVFAVRSDVRQEWVIKAPAGLSDREAWDQGDVEDVTELDSLNCQLEYRIDYEELSDD